MKVLARVTEERVRKIVKIVDNIMFVFMAGTNTTDAYSHSVSCRRNTWQRVKVNVRVGEHQGPVLGLLPFITMLEALSREFMEGLPGELLYADICPSLWPSGIGVRLGRNRLWVRFLAVSDIYPMFIEPTITLQSLRGSLGTYGLTQKLC